LLKLQVRPGLASKVLAFAAALATLLWILFGLSAFFERLAIAALAVLYGTAFWGVVRTVLVATAKSSVSVSARGFSILFLFTGMVGLVLGVGVALAARTTYDGSQEGIGLCLVLGSLGALLGVTTARCEVKSWPFST
jgi:hypothetical protein